MQTLGCFTRVRDALLAVSALALLVLAGGADSSARAQDLTGEISRLAVSNGSHRLCLDVPLRQMGVQLTSHACHAGDNQQFKLETRSDLNAIFLKVFNEGTCAGARDGKLVLVSCDASDSGQRWWYHSSGALQNQADSRCIDVPGGSTANGTGLILWDCHGGWNQGWKREGVTRAAAVATPQRPTVALSDWVAQRFRQGGPRMSHEIGQVVGGIIGHDSGSIIAPGGGNIISTGGGNLTPAGVAGIIATGGGNIIATGGLNLKEYTAGIIAARGGNIIATGGGNFADRVLVDLVERSARLLNNDPEALGRIIATGGGNLIDKGSFGRLQQAATGAIIATGGGNVVSPPYMTALRAGIISTGGGNIIAPGGGNLTLSDRGAFLGRTFDLTGMKEDFLTRTVAGLSRGSGYGTLSTDGKLNADALRGNGFSSSYVDALVSRGYATVAPPAPVVRAYQGESSPTAPPSQPSTTTWSPPTSSTGDWGASTTPMTRGQGYSTRTWETPSSETALEADERDASELRAEIIKIDRRIDRLERSLESATDSQAQARLQNRLQSERERRATVERLLEQAGG